LGQSLEEVAAEYDLTLAEVYAAIAFYNVRADSLSSRRKMAVAGQLVLLKFP
jgi:uncharacterized protein (DUF433 family)